PLADTTSVAVPAPRKSAGTSTWISFNPGKLAGTTVSTITGLPLIVADTLLAFATPVTKIDSRNSLLEGSNGPAVSVSEFRMIACPLPPAATVNTPGAAFEMMASAFDCNPSPFVTRNCAGPVVTPLGTTNTTSLAET